MTVFDICAFRLSRGPSASGGYAAAVFVAAESSGIEG
jgi:hypothetical protein